MKATRQASKPRRSWGKNLVLLLSIFLNIYFFLTHSSAPSALRHLGYRIAEMIDKTRKVMSSAGDGAQEMKDQPPGEIIVRRRHEDTTPPLSTETGKIPSAVRRASRAIVWLSSGSDTRLISELTAEQRQNAGIGTVVWRDSHAALIVTAAHLIKSQIPEISTSPDRPSVPVEVLAQDVDADLALLRTSTRAIPASIALKLEAAAVTRAPSLGLLWFPVTPDADEKILFRSGLILGRPKDIYRQVAKRHGLVRAEHDWFILSEPSFHGLSGAPVISSSGSLVGILIGGAKYRGGADRTLIMGRKALTAFLLREAPREFQQ